MKVLQTEFIFSKSESKLATLETANSASSSFQQLFAALQLNEGVVEESINESIDNQSKSFLLKELNSEITDQSIEVVDEVATVLDEQILVEPSPTTERQQPLENLIQIMPWVPKGLISLPKDPIPKVDGVIETLSESIPLTNQSNKEHLVKTEGFLKIVDTTTGILHLAERVNGRQFSKILKEDATKMQVTSQQNIHPVDLKMTLPHEIKGEQLNGENIEILEKPSLLDDPSMEPLIENKKQVSLVLSPNATRVIERLSMNTSVQSKEFEPLRTELGRFLVSPIRESISSGSALRIQVFPEHLGHIDLLVSIEEGAVRVQLAATSLHAKEAIEQQLPQLRQSLFDQGVLVQSIDIEWRSEKEFTKQQSQQRETSTDQQQSKSNQEEFETTKTKQYEEASGIDYSV